MPFIHRSLFFGVGTEPLWSAAEHCQTSTDHSAASPVIGFAAAAGHALVVKGEELFCFEAPGGAAEDIKG